MKRLTFQDMLFSRSSDAWCPVTGIAFGENTPRIVPAKILSSVGSIPTYYKFPASQGYVRYNNEVGCYDRDGSTHVFTDEMDALETRLSGYPAFERGNYGYGGGQTEYGYDLEYLSYGDLEGSLPMFLVTTLIHGNEADGILGTLRAFETLVTHPDFAPLREAYTIACLPCCNPDGYAEGERLLAVTGPHPSGDDQYINLNRVWPWFWDEFIPTSDESKGATTVSSSIEGQSMNVFRSLLPVAWALDQHATAGDGARYVSRDRNFRFLGEDEQEKVWADWIILRLLRSIQTKRVIEDSQPDLWINYYRSRWRPHWHSYLGTLASNDNGGIQAVSLVGEHNKVPTQSITSDLETYQSASNYNFDHVISLALLAQGGIVEKKAAVFVEHETGINVASNSKFEKWHIDEYRPDYWAGTRGDITASLRSECHMQGPGRPVRFSPDVTMELPLGYYCDETGGSDIVMSTGLADPVILVTRSDPEVGQDLGVFTWDKVSDPALLFSVAEGDFETRFYRQWRLGDADITSDIYMVGLGLAEAAGPSLALDARFDKHTNTAGVWAPATLLTHTTPLEDAGAQLDYTNKSIYIFGGRTGAATVSVKVFKADCVAETFTEVGTDLIGATGRYGMGSCWCEGGDLDGTIVLVGSDDTGDGMTQLAVRVFTPGGPTLTTYYVDVPSDLFEVGPLIYHCGVCYDGVDTVWVYGGQDPGTFAYLYKVFSMTWNGSGFDEAVEHTLTTGLSDAGNPDDYSGSEDWILRYHSWRALRTVDSVTGTVTHTLFGGHEADEVAVYETGFYAHYLENEVMARPAYYNYGYLRYNAHFDIGGYDKAVTSWSYKIDPDSVDGSTATSAYVRLSNAPGDSGEGILSTRRQRSYYLHPPSWWWREHAAIDFSMASPDVTEDEWRAYCRGYRQAQTILVDAPMIQTGTLWPSSWSPSGMTRAVETASWPGAVDNRFYRIKLDWLPAAPFMAASSGTFPLFTLGDNVADQRIEVHVSADNVDDRAYYRDGVVGPAEPKIEFRLIDGVSTTTETLPVYWGGYVKDAAMGRFESSIQFEVWSHVRYGVGIIVRNGWSEGHVRIPTRVSPTYWSSTGDLTIMGGGWWSEPETLPLDPAWKRKYLTPDNPNGALLIGDRDPTYGQVSERGTFRFTETFTRSDDPNLGDSWDVIQQTGNGFNISSNTARCEELGWERWDAYPYVRDCSIFADVAASDGCRVGFFTRMHWGMASKGFVHGFAGYLECTSASTADLVIETKFWNAGAQGKTELKRTAISYTEDSTVTLELEAVGDDITLRVGAQTTTYNSSAHPLPGAFGILGETTGEGVYVWIDDVYAELRGGLLLRITE